MTPDATPAAPVTAEELDRLRAAVAGQLDLERTEWEWQRAAQWAELDGAEEE